MAEGKSALLIGMSQWNSNDLAEQMETMGKLDERPGEPLLLGPGCVHARAAGARAWVTATRARVSLGTSPNAVACGSPRGLSCGAFCAGRPSFPCPWDDLPRGHAFLRAGAGAISDLRGRQNR